MATEAPAAVPKAGSADAPVTEEATAPVPAPEPNEAETKIDE